MCPISLKILFLHGHFCSIARHLWNCTLLSFIWKIGFFCRNFCNKNSHFIFSNFSEQHIHITTISSDNYCSIYIRIVFCKKISYVSPNLADTMFIKISEQKCDEYIIFAWHQRLKCFYSLKQISIREVCHSK